MNVVLVKKKDGGVWLCVDYCKFNVVMEFDWYLLLCIEDVFYVVKIIVYMLMFDFYFGYF